MSIQVKRIILVFVIFIALMLVLRHFLVPDSWEEYGHYRGDALKEIAYKTPKFVQMDDCAACHDSIAELKSSGEHKSLQCEICHGAGYQHIDDPEGNKELLPSGRQFCLRCHTLNPARSNDEIKQVDPIEHNTDEECITCHNPHQPWL